MAVLRLYPSQSPSKGFRSDAEGGKRPSGDDRWGHGANTRTPSRIGLRCQWRYCGSIQVNRRARASDRMLKAVRGHLVMIGGGTARTPERHLALVSAVNGGIAALSKSIAEQGLPIGC